MIIHVYINSTHIKLYAYAMAVEDPLKNHPQFVMNNGSIENKGVQVGTNRRLCQIYTQAPAFYRARWLAKATRHVKARDAKV